MGGICDWGGRIILKHEVSMAWSRLFLEAPAGLQPGSKKSTTTIIAPEWAKQIWTAEQMNKEWWLKKWMGVVDDWGGKIILKREAETDLNRISFPRPQRG